MYIPAFPSPMIFASKLVTQPDPDLEKKNKFPLYIVISTKLITQSLNRILVLVNGSTFLLVQARLIIEKYPLCCVFIRTLCNSALIPLLNPNLQAHRPFQSRPFLYAINRELVSLK